MAPAGGHGPQRRGGLYLLRKDQVAEVTREQSLMPKVEATPTEMRDLIAYLSRLTIDPNAKDILGAGETGAGISFAGVAQPKPGEWPTYHGNESGNRFSPLRQIDTANVQRLAPKWMFPIPGVARGLEVTPVVVDGGMYVTAANAAYALDARNGRQIWHYSRPRTQRLAAYRPAPTSTIRTSITLVPVGPVTTKSPSASK